MLQRPCPLCAAPAGQPCTTAPFTHRERGDQPSTIFTLTPDPYAPTADLIVECDRLRAEVRRLTDVVAMRGSALESLRVEVQTMAISFTQAHIDLEAARNAMTMAHIEARAKEREAQRVQAELDRTHKQRFTEGFRRAAQSIRDHFASLRRIDVVTEIEKIWRPEKAETT